MICQASVIGDRAEDEIARQLLLEKYMPRYSGDLTEWARTAVAVAIELPEPPAEG
jgi:hypothetical protein